MAIEGEALERGLGAAGGADVGEARDAEDDGGAAVEVRGLVRVAAGESFSGGFFEGVCDGEEGVRVGVGEGVVDVFLDRGDVSMGVYEESWVGWGSYGDQLREDRLKVDDGSVVEWID